MSSAMVHSRSLWHAELACACKIFNTCNELLVIVLERSDGGIIETITSHFICKLVHLIGHCDINTL
jgi:lysophospholipid acyltransferase (LPLAT)-like uncharacterized protein